MKEFNEIKNILLDNNCKLFRKNYGLSDTLKFVAVEISIAEEDKDIDSDAATNGENVYFIRQDRNTHRTKQKLSKHRSQNLKNDHESKIVQKYRNQKILPF